MVESKVSGQNLVVDLTDATKEKINNAAGKDLGNLDDKGKTVIKEVSEQLYEHAQWELNTRIATLEACEPYEIFAAEAQKIVNDTLDLLPERTREIFIMSRIQNLPHKEIAEKLNISYKSVEFHITKALRELRIQLKDYLPFLFISF